MRTGRRGSRMHGLVPPCPAATPLHGRTTSGPARGDGRRQLLSERRLQLLGRHQQHDRAVPASVADRGQPGRLLGLVGLRRRQLPGKERRPDGGHQDFFVSSFVNIASVVVAVLVALMVDDMFSLVCRLYTNMLLTEQAGRSKGGGM
jgi:hypothetical protein